MKSPMLAAATDGKGLKYPLLVSCKLDGVRALVINGVVVSRKFKPIPNKHVQKLFGRAQLNGLDGELIVGSATAPTCFSDTMSGVMSEDGEPDVVFHVFDDITKPDSCFVDRLDRAYKKSLANRVAYVNHRQVQTEEQLNIFEEAAVSDGFEGVMLRSPLGPYKQGRSTVKEAWLLKLKRFDDSEAEVIGFSELETNTNEKKVGRGGVSERSHRKAGMVGLTALGAFLVRDVKSGVEFSVGSGFTAEQRKDYWDTRSALVGKIVKYQFFPLGSKLKPRFPTFKGFRDPIDM